MVRLWCPNGEIMAEHMWCIPHPLFEVSIVSSVHHSYCCLRIVIPTILDWQNSIWIKQAPVLTVSLGRCRNVYQSWDDNNCDDWECKRGYGTIPSGRLWHTYTRENISCPCWHSLPSSSYAAALRSLLLQHFQKLLMLLPRVYTWEIVSSFFFFQVAVPVKLFW